MANKKQEFQPEEPVTEQTASAEAESAEVQEAPETAPLEAELAAEKEKYLRLAAEYDNYRKRSQKEREALFTDVRCDTISKLLPVYDNLERALAQETADEAYAKGVEMTMNQLKDIFEKLGVTAIPAVGQKFDPTFHNAVMHIEDEAYGENEVVAEFQKGFQYKDKVIRFSMVQVAN